MQPQPQPQPQPFDLIRLNLDLPVFVKMRGARELRAKKLVAFDQHLNLVLEGVQEDSFSSTESMEELKKVTRELEMLFVRGDGILLISPIQSSK